MSTGEEKPTGSIIIGCDHAAYGLKEKIKEVLAAVGFTVEDVGAFGEASVDYPDFGKKVASGVSRGDFDRGILICGTGIGMSMVANKYKNVRAALCAEPFSASMSRRHNDANILVLGSRVTGEALALNIVDTWLHTPFEGGRHQVRLDKFSHLGKCAEDK
ncbi:MAG: ribose 5-phosphate isomerase [Deltaproteobacteria bacterium SG8_13]|nr:MAG: ribose 5-phosphate isomerase [Deltaproteobacteria bacterium SG8_13]